MCTTLIADVTPGRSRDRLDLALRETMHAFDAAWRRELVVARVGPAAAALQAAGEFRYRDQRVLVWDSNSRLIAASDSAPLIPTLDARPGVIGAGVRSRARWIEAEEHHVCPEAVLSELSRHRVAGQALRLEIDVPG